VDSAPWGEAVMLTFLYNPHEYSSSVPPLQISYFFSCFYFHPSIVTARNYLRSSLLSPVLGSNTQIFFAWLQFSIHWHLSATLVTKMFSIRATCPVRLKVLDITFMTLRYLLPHSHQKCGSEYFCCLLLFTYENHGIRIADSNCVTHHR